MAYGAHGLGHPDVGEHVVEGVLDVLDLALVLQTALLVALARDDLLGVGLLDELVRLRALLHLLLQVLLRLLARHVDLHHLPAEHTPNAPAYLSISLISFASVFCMLLCASFSSSLLMSFSVLGAGGAVFFLDPNSLSIYLLFYIMQTQEFFINLVTISLELVLYHFRIYPNQVFEQRLCCLIPFS